MNLYGSIVSGAHPRNQARLRLRCFSCSQMCSICRAYRAWVFVLLCGVKGAVCVLLSPVCGLYFCVRTTFRLRTTSGCSDSWDTGKNGSPHATTLKSRTRIRQSACRHIYTHPLVVVIKIALITIECEHGQHESRYMCAAAADAIAVMCAECVQMFCLLVRADPINIDTNIRAAPSAFYVCVCMLVFVAFCGRPYGKYMH